MRERLPGLDALRGIAALVVVAFHIGLPIAGAHLAVDFFFMLSGFVMARTYEGRLRTGDLTGIEFLRKRYLRLWPWMAAGTSIGLLVALASGGGSFDLWLAYGFTVLMLPAFNLPAAPYLLNLPLWSIFYELVANAVHGLWLARARAWTLGAIALASAVGLALTIRYAGFPRGGFAEYHFLVLFRVFLAYLIGVLIYRRFGDAAPVRVPFWIAGAMLPAYVGAVMVWPAPWAPLVFILALCPLMLWGGVAARFGTGRALTAAATLGAVSFPLYATHYPLLVLLQTGWGAPVLAAALVLGWAWWRRRARPQPAAA